MSLFLDIID